MKTDIVVIGGGLTGSAIAWFLAREGAEVTLLEAGDLNTQASGTNAGSIHLQIPHPEYVKLGADWARAYAPSLRLLRASLEMWQTLPNELGADLDVKLAGGLVVATTETQLRQIEEKARIERSAGVETEILTREDLHRIAPYLTPDAIGAGFCAMEGKANPLRATPAFADAARAAGATICTHMPVSGLEHTPDGYRISTPKGLLHARRVVNAAGARAAEIGAHLGIHIALQGFALQVTATQALAPLIPHLVYSAAGKLSVKQARNGTCLIGGGWAARQRADGTLSVNPSNLSGNLATAAQVIPALESVQTVRTWTAIVNGTADWRPIIGEVPGHKGFFLALFPWMGFSAGPMTARLIADMILGLPPRMSLSGISVLHDA
ncbi:MAG: NAD(P)/FAD-dependent oxidoreductase [Roseinatronobacter sp.]